MGKKKVSEIKEEMGYTSNNPVCSNCVNFSSETIGTKSKYSAQVFYKDKNLKCNLGGFAVKKTTWCKHHVYAD